MEDIWTDMIFWSITKLHFSILSPFICFLPAHDGIVVFFLFFVFCWSNISFPLNVTFSHSVWRKIKKYRETRSAQTFVCQNVTYGHTSLEMTYYLKVRKWQRAIKIDQWSKVNNLAMGFLLQFDAHQPLHDTSASWTLQRLNGNKTHVYKFSLGSWPLLKHPAFCPKSAGFVSILPVTLMGPAV